jgi:hypothetical protein
MYAVITLINHLIVQNSETANHEMINVSWYIWERFSSQKLETISFETREGIPRRHSYLWHRLNLRSMCV